jgi:biotin carboxyl carrier protein
VERTAIIIQKISIGKKMEDLILKMNNKEFHSHCVENDDCAVLINNKPFQVELLKELSNNVYSFSVNQKLYFATIDFSSAEKKVDIIMDGMSYSIDITDATKKLLEKYLKESGALNNNTEFTIKAPMPGMIVKVLVSVGAEVKEGDKLVIVEAMKMENVLKSPVTGKVKSISANEGTAVDKNTVLIELEPLNE